MEAADGSNAVLRHRSVYTKSEGGSRKEHRVGLEFVFAVQDGAAFVVGCAIGEEDVRGQIEKGGGGWSEGCEVVDYDGRIVGQEKAEDLVADFGWQVEEQHEDEVIGFMLVMYTAQLQEV